MLGRSAMVLGPPMRRGALNPLWRRSIQLTPARRLRLDNLRVSACTCLEHSLVHLTESPPRLFSIKRLYGVLHRAVVAPCLVTDLLVSLSDILHAAHSPTPAPPTHVSRSQFYSLVRWLSACAIELLQSLRSLGSWPGVVPVVGFRAQPRVSLSTRGSLADRTPLTQWSLPLVQGSPSPV